MFVPKRTESSCAELVPSEFWLIYFPRFFFSAPKKTRGVSPSPTEGTGCSSTCGESRLSGTAFQGAAPQLLWGRAPSRTRRLNGQEDEALEMCQVFLIFFQICVPNKNSHHVLKKPLKLTHSVGHTFCSVTSGIPVEVDELQMRLVSRWR